MKLRDLISLFLPSFFTLHLPLRLNQAYFLCIFKKLKAQKTQPLKKLEAIFCQKKLNMSGFFEASYKKLNANDFNKHTFPKADGIN